MAQQTRLNIAKQDIESYFDGLQTRTFIKQQLANILNQERSSWRLAQRTTTEQFIEYLAAKSRLQLHRLKAPKYDRELTRFSWGPASAYAIALTVGRSSAYLSHATAIFIHGLSQLIPRQIFVNDEQSPKPSSKATLTQQSITRAFQAMQRSSSLIYETDQGASVVVLQGKATGCLEVELAQDPAGAKVRVTSIERTLIDAVVRPSYAGGLDNVVAAYRAARESVSANRMRATLMALNYMYPYHQSIGYLMELTGYSASRVDIFRAMGQDHDFYLTHRMPKTRFIESWRLHVPDTLT